MWDSDSDEDETEAREHHKKCNRKLRRLANHAEDDFPDGVEKFHAAHGVNLEHTVWKPIEAKVFRPIMNRVRSEFGYTDDDAATKNQDAVSRLIEETAKAGTKHERLESIVKAAVGLNEARKYVLIGTAAPGDTP